MPDKKIDFTKAMAANYSFQELRAMGAEVAMPSKEGMVKSGVDQKWVDQNYDKFSQDFESYSSGEYIGQYTGGNGLSSRLADFPAIERWRGPGYATPIKNAGIVNQWGYSKSGDLTATPTQVAWNQGFYYDKQGNQQEIGNWLQRTWDTYFDAGTKIQAFPDETGNYVFKEVNTWQDIDQQLNESRLAQKHGGGKVNNKVVDPGQLYVYESAFMDVDKINYATSQIFYDPNFNMGMAPQPMDRTWMGELRNSFVNGMAKVIPSIATGIIQEISDLGVAWETMSTEQAVEHTAGKVVQGLSNLNPLMWVEKGARSLSDFIFPEYADAPFRQEWEKLALGEEVIDNPKEQPAPVTDEKWKIPEKINESENTQLSRANLSYLQEISGKRSYAATQESMWSGRNISAGIGDLASQLLAQFTVAKVTGGGKIKPGGSKVGNFARANFGGNAGYAFGGLMAMTQAQQIMLEAGIAPEDRAWIAPLIGVASFAIEKTGPDILYGGAIEKGAARKITKEFAREASANELKKSMSEAGIKTWAKATGSQKLAFSKSFAQKLAQTYNTKTVKGFIEEGREEFLEQLTNDIIFNTYDYFNQNKVDKPLFNDWDNQKNYFGNLWKDMDGDEYLQSFLLGGLGGGAAGGIHSIINGVKNGFQRDTAIDKISQMVVEGKGDRLLKYANSKKAEKAFGGWWTDGQNILNEGDKNNGAKTLGSQVKNAYIAEVQRMMDVYETYGVKNAKSLKVFGNDMSLAATALGAAASVQKLKTQRDAMAVEMTSLADDAAKQDMQTKINKIDGMIADRTKKLDYFLKPENKIYSKAYNDRQKEFATVMELSKSVAQQIITKREQTEKKPLSDIEKNLTIANVAQTAFNNIARGVNANPYTGYRQFFASVNEKIKDTNERNTLKNEAKNNAQLDISTTISSLRNKLGELSNFNPELDEINKVIDEEYTGTEGLDEDQISEASAKHKEKKKTLFNERIAKINEHAKSLSTLIGDMNSIISASNDAGINDDNEIAIKQLQKGVQDAIDNMSSIEDFNDVEDMKSADVADLSNMAGSYKFDTPIKKLGESILPLYSGENAQEGYLKDLLKNGISSIEKGIEDKNDPMGLKQALSELELIILGAEEAYMTSKAISGMDKEHHSADDVIRNDAQIAEMQDVINASKEKLEGLKTKVSELVADKDLYAKYYRKNIVKSHFLTWKNLFLGKTTVLFGAKSDEVIKLVDRAEKLLIDKDAKNVLLDDSKINDEKLIELDSIMGDLWQIYYESKDIIANAKIDHQGETLDGIKWIMAQFDFGMNGLLSMTGRNAMSKEITDNVLEPIMYFSVPNAKDNGLDYFAEPWRIKHRNNGLYDNKSATYYSLFIAQNIFANVLGNLGESVNNMTRHYNGMQAATNYDDSNKNVSSLEQASSEILCAQLMCLAASKNNYMKDALQYYADLSISRWGDKNEATNKRKDVEPILGRLINFTGFGGTGKTNNSMLKALELFRLATGKQTLNVSVGAFNNTTTTQLADALKDPKIKVKSKKSFSEDKGVDSLDYNVDVVVFDEASLLRKPELNTIVTNARNSNAVILNLSDNTQMGESIISRPITHDYGITINPLMLVFRTNIPQIVQLADYFRNRVVFPSLKKPLPKVFSRIENDKLYGAKYYRNKNDIHAEFDSRIKAGANAIMIVESKEEYNAVIANKPEWNGRVFIVTKDRADADLSIQGRQGEEVFISFELEQEGMEGNIGYTSVTRARNFVGMIDTNGQNANDVSEVYWNTAPYELTKEQKIEKGKELIEYNRRTRKLGGTNTQQYATTTANGKSVSGTIPSSTSEETYSVSEIQKNREALYNAASSEEINLDYLSMPNVAREINNLPKDLSYDDFSYKREEIISKYPEEQKITLGQAYKKAKDNGDNPDLVQAIEYLMNKISNPEPKQNTKNKGTHGGKNNENFDHPVQIEGTRITLGSGINTTSGIKPIVDIYQGKSSGEYKVLLEGETSARPVTSKLIDNAVEDGIEPDTLAEDNSVEITPEEIQEHKIDRTKHAYATHYNINFKNTNISNISNEFASFVRAIKNDIVSQNIFNKTPEKIITRHLSDDGTIGVESEKLFMRLNQATIDNLTKTLKTNEYTFGNGKVVNTKEIPDWNIDTAIDILSNFAVLGTTKELDSMYNKVNASPTDYAVNKDQSKIIRGRIDHSLVNSYDNVETADELVRSLTEKGLKTEIRWSKKIGGIPTLIVTANDGSESVVKLTAFTVAEHIKRNNDSDEPDPIRKMIDDAIMAVETAIDKAPTDPRKLAEAVNTVCSTELYQFCKKNFGLPGFTGGVIMGQNYNDLIDGKRYADIVGNLKSIREEYEKDLDKQQKYLANAFLPTSLLLNSKKPNTLKRLRNNGKYNVDVFAPRIFFSFEPANATWTPPAENQQEYKDEGEAFLANLFSGEDTNAETVDTASTETVAANDAVDLMNKLWGESMVENGFKMYEGVREAKFYEDGKEVIKRLTGYTNPSGLFVSTINGRVRVTTPKHEFAHWVLRFNLPQSLYSQLLNESRQMISEEYGLAKEAISETMANEHIAEMYGNTGMRLAKRDAWYSRFPVIAKFVEMLRQAFAKIGLYKYKINDLMFAMDMGYFANAKVGPDQFHGEEQYETEEVGQAKNPLKKGNTDIAEKFGSNKLAIDGVVNLFATRINKFSMFNPYTESTISLEDSINTVFERVVKHEPTTILKSTGVTVQTVYENPSMYMDVLLKNFSDFHTYMDYVLNKDYHKAQLVDRMFRGTVNNAHAKSNISEKARTVDHKDLVNVMIKWQLGQIPLRSEDKNIIGNVSPNIIDNVIAGMNYAGIDKDPAKMVSDLRTKAKFMSADSVAKAHIVSFCDHIDALMDKSIRMKDKNKQVANEIVNFVNGYFSNRGSLVRSNIEAAELVFNKDGQIEKLTIQSRNPSTVAQMKTHVKNKIANTLSNGGEGVRRKVQDFMRDNFTFTEQGIINRRTGNPLVKYTTKGSKIENMYLNLQEAPAVFSRMKNVLGLNTITDSHFNDILKAERVSDLPGYSYIKDLNSGIDVHKNKSISEYMGNQMGMFLALVNQQSLIGKVQAAINYNAPTEKMDINENEALTLAIETVTGEKMFGFSDVQKKNPGLTTFMNKILNDTNNVTNKKYSDEIWSTQKVVKGYLDEYNYVPDNVDYLTPEELGLFTDVFAGVKALNNETNTTKTHTDSAGNKRTINNSQTPISKITPDKMQGIATSMSDDSYLKNGEDGAHSMFIGATNWNVIEFDGARAGQFGKTELDSHDQMLIDLTDWRKNYKKGKLRIPLIPFGSSMRSHYLSIHLQKDQKLNEQYASAIKNGLNRSKRAYDLSREHTALAMKSFVQASEINLLAESKTIDQVKRKELSKLYDKIKTLTNLTYNDVDPEKYCKAFMDVQSKFESLVATGDKDYLDLYSKYYASVLGSGMYQVRDYNEGGVLYYKNKNGYFQYNQVNDKESYSALKKLRPGNAMRFGYQINELGEKQSLKARNEEGSFRNYAYTSNIWNYDFYKSSVAQKLLNTEDIDLRGNVTLVNSLLDITDTLLSQDMRAFASTASNVFFEMKGTDDKHLMIPTQKIGGKDVYTLNKEDGLYDFYMSTLLFGEDFNASFMGAHFDFKDAEDNRKRLKQYLTGCTYANSRVANNGMRDVFLTVYTSTEFGFADFGNGVTDMVKIADGGSVLSSLGNRVHANNLGDKFSMFTGTMKKDLATTFDPKTGENISMKNSSFDPTDDMIEANRDLMKMQVVLLNLTRIQDFKDGQWTKLGELYDAMFKKGMKHSEIIDNLYERYTTAYNVEPLALKFGDQEISKITPKNINFGTVEDLYQMSINGVNPVARTHKIADLGFIYNPEIEVNEDSQAMKVIQQESILPLSSDKYAGSINTILNNMNEFAHDEFAAENGFDLRDLAHGIPSPKMAEKIKQTVRNYAVKGLEGKNSFGTLIDIMKYLSFDIPPILESAYQSWVNIHSNEFGHRKKVAGDRNMKMFGHGFKMIVKDGRRYNLIEYAKHFNNGVRLTDEQIESLNAEPVRYMKLDENKLIQREEAVGNFKYFDFFNLREGEQPTDLMSIYKKNEKGQEQRLDIRDGLENFNLKRGDSEVKFHMSQDEQGEMSFYEGKDEVTLERYASMYYTFMANNKDIYDFDKSPLLRTDNDFSAQFSDKLELLVIDGLLNFQSSRIPFTSHSYHTLCSMVAFMNHRRKDIDGTIKNDHANLMFRNGRGNARDGGDFDGDASTDNWLNIVEYKDKFNFRRYHAKTSEEVASPTYKEGANPEFKTEANSLFWKHEEIMNDPETQEFAFRLTTTEEFKKVKAERYGKRIESVEGEEITPVQERTNPHTYYMANRLNASDKDLIGHQAQGLSVTAELSQLSPENQRKILPGVELPHTRSEKLTALNIYDAQMQTILDGEKDNISGPFGFIKEFSGVDQYFLDNKTRIPISMLPELGKYEMADAENAIFNANAMWEFYNQPVVVRVRNRAMRGRRFMESTFANSLHFSISQEVINTINLYKVRSSDLEMLGLTDSNLGYYNENVAVRLQGIIDAENAQRVGDSSKTQKQVVAEKVLRLMKDLRILHEWQRRLPSMEAKRYLGMANGFRKEVWAKTTDTKNLIRRVELVTGMPINDLAKLFFDEKGTVRTIPEIETLYKYDPQKAAEFYKNNSGEFYKTEKGGLVLKSSAARPHTEEYLSFIDQLFQNMNMIEYFKQYPQTLGYLRNLIIDNNVRKVLSTFNGENLENVAKQHFDNIRINNWQYDSQEVDFNDEYNRYVIESCIAGLYSGKPVGVSSWYENDEDFNINDSYSSLDLGIATDRNFFLSQMPEMVRSFLEIGDIARSDKAKAKSLISKLIASNGWSLMDDAKLNALVENMPKCTFLKNIELFGRGQSRGVQYASQEFGEYDSTKLLKQRNDLNMYPKEFVDNLKIFNVLRFGYRTKKTFFDVIGSDIYSRIDNYQKENQETIKSGNEDFLPAMYSLVKNLPYGTELADDGVIMNDYQKAINIQAGKIGTGTGTTNVHIHRTAEKDGDSINYKEVARFNKFANIGGNYKVATTNDIDTYTENPVVKTLNSEEVAEFLKFGNVTVVNVKGNYPEYIVDEKTGKAERIVYQLAGQFVHAKHNGDELTFVKIQGETAETLSANLDMTRIVVSKNQMIGFLNKKFNEKINEDGNTVYTNVAFYDTSLSEKAIQETYGNNYHIVCEGIYETTGDKNVSGYVVPKGIKQTYQFAKNAIKLKINSSYKMHSIWAPDIEKTLDDTERKIKQDSLNANRAKIIKAVDQFKNELLSARASGKIILFPNFGKRGLGFALAGNSAYRDIYEDLSTFLYNNFGYYNLAANSEKGQEVLTLSENPAEACVQKFYQYQNDYRFTSKVKAFLNNPGQTEINNVRGGVFLGLFNDYVEQLKESSAEIIETGKMTDEDVYQEAKKYMMEKIERHKNC